MERQLKGKKAEGKKSQLTPLKAIDIIKTIYRLQLKLPESLGETTILFTREKDQIELLNLFGFSVNLD